MLDPILQILLAIVVGELAGILFFCVVIMHNTGMTRHYLSNIDGHLWEIRKSLRK